MLFEFQMPNSSCTTASTDCADKYANSNASPNQPAIWSIPTSSWNVGAFGTCNGWNEGSGELDIAEVLGSPNPLDSAFVSTHMVGADRYANTVPQALKRPVDGTMKLAVIIDESTASVKIQTLPDDFTFDASFENSDVLNWATGASTTPGLSALVETASKFVTADVSTTSKQLAIDFST